MESEFGPNVFSGRHAGREFLAPQNQVMRIVELTDPALNPYAPERVRFFLNPLFYTGLLQSKQVAAWGMLETLQREGQLKGVHTLVVASSGNTGWALPVIARQFGIPNVFVVVPNGVPEAKTMAIRTAGGAYATTSRPHESAIAKAKRLAKENPGWLYFDQYQHPGNPAAFRLHAQRLWQEFRGALTVCCVPIGTSGTITGFSEVLGPRAASPTARATLVGVTCDPDGGVPGVRGLRQLEEVGFISEAGGFDKWRQQVLDVHIGGISAKEAYRHSALLLQRGGVPAGVSSGLALVGAGRVVADWKRAGTLDQRRNQNGEVVVVVVAPDPIHFYTNSDILSLELNYVEEQQGNSSPFVDS